MFDPDLDLHDTDELLNDLGYINLDPLPAHLDPERFSPCDLFSDADMFDDHEGKSLDHQHQCEGIPIPAEDCVPTEELP